VSKSTGLLVAILVTAFFLRAWNLSNPPELVFDENHYQPAAAYLAGKIPWPGIGDWDKDPVASKSADPNFYHPPLGKLLIAVGITTFGNTGFGWRCMAMLFGMGSLVVFYFLALRLWQRKDIALAALFLLSLDFLHLVQSRVAMLDIFGFFFAQVAFLGLVHVRENPRDLRWNAVAVGGLGGALCVKYPNMTVALAFALSYLLPSTQTPFRKRFLFLCGIGLGTLLVILFSSSWSLYKGLSFSQWFNLQFFSFQKLTGKFPPHSYGSSPPAWLFNSRAVWYYFKDTGHGFASIIGMGNPVIWLAFIPFSYFFARLKDFATNDKMVAIWFAANFFPHFIALWERQGFIYYMLPAVGPMVLILARTVMSFSADRRWSAAYLGAAAIAAAYFYPFLVALPVPPPYYGTVVRWVTP